MIVIWYMLCQKNSSKTFKEILNYQTTNQKLLQYCNTQVNGAIY